MFQFFNRLIRSLIELTILKKSEISGIGAVCSSMPEFF